MTGLEAAALNVNPGDRVQFSVDAGGGAVMQGEGFIVAIEPRGPNASGNFAHVAVLGVPSLVVLPVLVCHVLEHGALIRRVSLS